MNEQMTGIEGAGIGPGTGTGEKLEPVFIAWDPEDELMKNASRYAIEYKEGSEARDKGEAARVVARDKLRQVIDIVAVTQRFDPDSVDGLVLSDVGDDGKHLLFRKTVSRGKQTISAELLLQKGVSAEIIKACTVQAADTVSWKAERVKPGPGHPAPAIAEFSN